MTHMPLYDTFYVHLCIENDENLANFKLQTIHI